MVYSCYLKNLAGTTYKTIRKQVFDRHPELVQNKQEDKLDNQLVEQDFLSTAIILSEESQGQEVGQTDSTEVSQFLKDQIEQHLQFNFEPKLIPVFRVPELIRLRRQIMAEMTSLQQGQTNTIQIGDGGVVGSFNN